ncbi:MAG: GNAT family N-acetyltransferase [Lachnospiraceae bacterium]|jgi:PhnO protein|nr:GNAT family N-acetyltransferase [Lachnospiraceae bacterium]
MEPEKLTFRKAGQDDCKDVYRLICELECKCLSYRDFSRIYGDQTENRNYYCLVCEYENQVAGVLNLRFEGQLHDAKRIAEIMEFVVDSGFRRMGIGKEMFSRACRLAQDFSCAQIELATNRLREEAHRFYEREGMHSHHFKFSKSLSGIDDAENVIGR